MYKTALTNPLSPDTQNPKKDNMTTSQQDPLDNLPQPGPPTLPSSTLTALDSKIATTEPASKPSVGSLAPAAASDNAPASDLPDAPSTAVQVRLTGRMLNFSRLTIHGSDLDGILAAISDKVGQKRQSNLPVVVSCHGSEGLDLSALWDGLWALGLQPIGLVTGELDDAARQLRIAIFPADGQRIDGKAKPARIGAGPNAAKPPTQATENAKSVPVSTGQPTQVDANSGKRDPQKLTIDTSAQLGSHLEGDLVHNPILRSGQSINHVGGDLILTHGINAGAEAITDYSLHVYGKAEGRLVAGATGDKNARIFCLKFNPSLVSVAGTYCLKEGIPQEFINQAVQVSYVEGQGLVFEHLATQ